VATTRTLLGSNALKTGLPVATTWTALTSITLSAGDTLIVLSALNNANTFVKATWNGIDLANDAINKANVTSCWMNACSLYITSGGTGNLVLTNSVNWSTVAAVGVIAIKVTGLASSGAFDQWALNGAAGTATPVTGTTGTLAQADEFLVSILGFLGPNTDAAGTWGGDTPNAGARVGTSGGGAASNIVLDEGYLLDSSSTTAKQGSKSGVGGTRGYCGLIVTYKTGATSFTGTGDVSFGVAGLAGTGTVPITGTGAVAFGVAGLSGTGAETFTNVGTANVTFKGPLLSGVGTWGVDGTGGVVFRGPALAATGAQTFTAASGNVTFRFALAGTGTVALPPITGTGAITFGVVGLAGVGTTGGATGTGGVSFAVAGLAGTGTILVAITGTGDVTFRVAGLAGTGSIPLPPQGIFLEMEFAGRGNGWTEVKDWRRADGLRWDRGLPGNGVADCIADTGTLNFVLNNAATNSAHLIGYYSPDHVNCRAGFQLMMGVRVRIVVQQNEYIRFTGYLDYIAPQPGMHQSFSVDCEAIGWMGLAARTRLGDLPILLDATGDEVFQTVVDSLPTFSQPRAIEKDVSADVYPYILDRIRDEETHANDELYRLALSGLDRIWERGDGTLVYESRTRRATRTANSDSFPDTHGFSAPRTADTVANSTQTTVHPRLPSPVTDAVLFSLNQPMQLAVGQPVDILGPWTDVNNPNVRVGAVGLVSLVAGTDYIANSQQDGSGSNLTPYLTVTVGLSGNATAFTVTLGGSSAGYLTKLQQRGQALLDYGDVQSLQTDQASIDQYGLNPLNVDLPYQADPNFGIEVAQYVIFTRGQPVTLVEAFRRVIGMTNSPELARSLGREISDRIGITEPVTGVQRSFFIDRITETVYATHVETEWSLSLPIDGRQFWQLEVVGRGELDINTRLGFGLIVGHTDVLHSDEHGDSEHGDVAHSDTHTDNPALNQLHGDGSSHGDSAHADAAHSDRAHSDVAHQDFHLDDRFQDHTDNTHSDSAHIDTHFDYHGDFVDEAHGVSFGDHGDTHTDQAHGDAHGDSPHIDEAHEDGHDDIGHTDVSHGDTAHVDVAHNDASSHSDVQHADQLHGDVPHVDVIHSDAPHSDSHGDTAHGDAN